MKINRKRLKQILRDITDIYSPSGKEEAVLRYICGLLAENGYSFIRQPVSEGRFNIIIKPSGGKSSVVFLGHLDTVSAYDLDRYEFEEKRGIVRGLGVADMKGGCAAMLEAFISYLEKHKTTPSCALALVVGEEENSDGINKLLEEHSFKFAIVGEPTDMKPCLKHSGYIEIELRLSGSRRHASLSCGEDNATYSMLKTLLNTVTCLDSYGGKVRYNIRDLHSSDSGFAVPERCGAWLDVHVDPDISVNSIALKIKKLTKECVKELGVKKSNFQVKADVCPGYKLSANWKGFSRIKKVLEKNSFTWEPCLFESHSDAAVMRQKNTKPLILGPGRLSKAHTKDESVPFRQVATASQVYADLLTNL